MATSIPATLRSAQAKRAGNFYKHSIAFFYSNIFFMTNIFIAKLNYDTQGEDLREVFEDFGEVISAKVIFDRFTNRSRGFGFVEMENDQDALAAIDELNGAELDGRTIVVKKAEPRRERATSSW